MEWTYSAVCLNYCVPSDLGGFCLNYTPAIHILDVPLAEATQVTIFKSYAADL